MQDVFENGRAIATIVGCQEWIVITQHYWRRCFHISIVTTRRWCWSFPHRCRCRLILVNCQQIGLISDTWLWLFLEKRHKCFGKAHIVINIIAASRKPTANSTSARFEANSRAFSVIEGENVRNEFENLSFGGGIGRRYVAEN